MTNPTNKTNMADARHLNERANLLKNKKFDMYMTQFTEVVFNSPCDPAKDVTMFLAWAEEYSGRYDWNMYREVTSNTRSSEANLLVMAMRKPPDRPHDWIIFNMLRMIDRFCDTMRPIEVQQKYSKVSAEEFANELIYGRSVLYYKQYQINLMVLCIRIVECINKMMHNTANTESDKREIARARKVFYEIFCLLHNSLVFIMDCMSGKDSLRVKYHKITPRRRRRNYIVQGFTMGDLE